MLSILSAGNLAIMTQGYPHLVTLNRAALHPVELDAVDRADLVLSRVRIASQANAAGSTSLGARPSLPVSLTSGPSSQLSPT